MNFQFTFFINGFSIYLRLENLNLPGSLTDFRFTWFMNDFSICLNHNGFSIYLGHNGFSIYLLEDFNLPGLLTNFRFTWLINKFSIYLVMYFLFTGFNLPTAQEFRFIFTCTKEPVFN